MLAGQGRPYSASARPKSREKKKLNDTHYYGLAGPPRPVPLSVRLRVLFGGFASQFGWLFFGFGLIFVWVFTLESDLTSWFRFAGDTRTATGVITASEGTNYSSSDVEIYRYTYAFSADDDVEYTGISYQTGGGDRTESLVTVEYLSGNPDISRIRGMRRGVLGLAGLFPVTFPAVGGLFMVWGLIKGRKAIHLLKHGRQTTGRLVAKEPTNTRINRQTVYKLSFEFRASDGSRRQAVARSHLPGILEDEAKEPLLYDPDDPDYCVMLDGLPGAPRIDQRGLMVASSPGSSVMLVVIPLVTILGHGVYLYLRYFAL